MFLGVVKRSPLSIREMTNDLLSITVDRHEIDMKESLVRFRFLLIFE